MLPKIHRVPSKDITPLLRTGKQVSLPELQLIYKINDLNETRFAVIVSTKIDKRAVVRNRVKRLIRESIAHLLLKFKIGIDGVFVVRKGLLGLNQTETEAKVKTLFERAGFI